MGWTQAHIDAARDALASGTTEVAYDGKVVKYRTLAELRSIIAEMEAAVSGSAPSRQHYPAYRRLPAP